MSQTEPRLTCLAVLEVRSLFPQCNVTHLRALRHLNLCSLEVARLQLPQPQEVVDNVIEHLSQDLSLISELAEALPIAKFPRLLHSQSVSITCFVQVRCQDQLYFIRSDLACPLSAATIAASGSILHNAVIPSFGFMCSCRSQCHSMLSNKCNTPKSSTVCCALPSAKVQSL